MQHLPGCPLSILPTSSPASPVRASRARPEVSLTGSPVSLLTLMMLSGSRKGKSTDMKPTAPTLPHNGG